MATSDTRWVWYGGRSSLDFVNTRRDRERAGVEYLTSRADLADWLEALGEAPGRIDDPLLAEALELREAIDTGVRAAIADEPTPRAALRTINSWLKVLPERPPQLRDEGGLTLLDSGAERSGARQALARLALDAAQLLGTDERVRLRVCAGEDCAGRFLDQSPAGRRRWCSMAVCGNRHKVAAHRRAAHD